MSPSPAQALLKRREGTTYEEFEASYKRHGQLVMPFWFAHNIKYYAQIYNLRWSSTEVAKKYSDVDLSQWDAAAMSVRDEVLDKGPEYYANVILPDEKRFLYSPAIEHLIVVDPGSVTGDVVEYFVDGKAMCEYDEWQREWEKWEGSGTKAS